MADFCKINTRSLEAAVVSWFREGRIVAQGFSLVELLIVLAIFSLLIGAVFSSLNEGQNRSQISREEAEMNQNLQDALSLMTSELRTAGFPPESYYDAQYLLNSSTRKNLVAQGLLFIGSQEIRFQGDLDSDKTVDYVRYYHTGSSAPYSLNRLEGHSNPMARCLAEPHKNFRNRLSPFACVILTPQGSRPQIWLTWSV